MYYICSKCSKQTVKRKKLNKEKHNIIIQYSEECFWCGHKQIIEGNWNIGYKVVGRGKK